MKSRSNPSEFQPPNPTEDSPVEGSTKNQHVDNLREFQAHVVRNRSVSENYYVLSLKTSHFPELEPGQFIQILCRKPGETHPFLRRPFTVMDRRDEILDVFYKIIGTGTRIMSQWSNGDAVSIIGPLGQPYSLSGSALIVAGGTGLGGVYYLCRQLKRQGYSQRLLYGVKTEPELPKQVLDSLGVPYDAIVEENSGFVTDRLSEIVRESYDVCYVCGPTPMIRAAINPVEDHVRWIEVSLEEMMGCGFGICYTCPVKRSDGRGYYRACDQGPVFREENVIL